jgi:transcriptional regulator with XRE-family HTH domain
MTKKSYEIMQQFVSHQLVKAREESKLTQKQVADSKIVSQSELSKIENGQRYIDFVTLIELAEFYKKDVSFFIKKRK